MKYFALAILSLCVNAESKGTTAFKNGIAVTKKMVNNVEDLGKDILGEAQTLRKQIQEWNNKIQDISDVQLDEYIEKLTSANTILVEVEFTTKAILKSVKRQTELEMRVLQKALDTGDQDKFQKAISNSQIIMKGILNKGIERFLELSTMLQNANKMYEDISNLSAKHKGSCEREKHSKDSKIARENKSLREKAYYGCIASIALGPLAPAAIAACYAAAVPAVEVTIANRWKDHAKLISDLDNFTAKFENLGNKAQHLVQVTVDMAADNTNTRTELDDKKENIVATDDFDFWENVILDQELPSLVEMIDSKI